MGSAPERDTSGSSSQAAASDSAHRILLLGAQAVCAALTPARCLAALEEAYASLHTQPDDRGQSVGFKTAHGKFHVKAGLTPLSHDYFAAKVNANFPGNPGAFGLPTIQGVVLLCAADNGRPVAILESGALTGLRTAAATALAAKHGARADARSLAMVGCGAQARYLVRALAGLFPIEEVIAFDTDAARAAGFASWVERACRVSVRTSGSLAEAVLCGDVCVTCTTSSQPIVEPDAARPGTFISAVGADNPDKQEVSPDLFANARILVDDLEQCASDGDLAHALRAGTVNLDNVHATLAELAAGAKRGRQADDEIVIFDSTGTGIQDVAAAAAAYEAALEQGAGQWLELDR